MSHNSSLSHYLSTSPLQLSIILNTFQKNQYPTICK